jgi:hypothetical protein
MSENKQTPGEQEKECTKQNCEGCRDETKGFICQQMLDRMEKAQWEERRRKAYPSFYDFYFACDMSIRLRQEGICLNTQAAETGYQSYQLYLKTQLAKSKEQLLDEMRAEINDKVFFTAHPLVIPKEIIIHTEED